MNQFRENFWKLVEDDIVKLMDEFLDELNYETKFPSYVKNLESAYAKRIINHVLKGHD